MKNTAPQSIITNNLLYHYPADKVFRAAVLAVNSLPKLCVDMIDERTGYIEVTTIAFRKSLNIRISLSISYISSYKTNLLIEHDEKKGNDAVLYKTKHITKIINAVSRNLN